VGISINNLLKAGKSKTNVGFFSDTTHPISPSTTKLGEAFGLKKPSASISTAFLAQILNNGYFNKLFNKPVAGRPFMNVALDNIKANLKSIIFEAVQSENPNEKLSEILKKYIQDAMLQSGYKDNTQLTKKFKSGSPPLIDEGALYNSIEAR
jgi:hypothetical protein